MLGYLNLKKVASVERDREKEKRQREIERETGERKIPIKS